MRSTNSVYRFQIYTTDSWRTPLAHGMLSDAGGPLPRVLWQGAIPHQYGPRFILVSPDGNVLLLDDWLNIKPRYAITIINNKKGLVASFTYEAVLRSLKSSASALASKARFGSWWIAGQPFFDASGTLVLVPAGGRILVVDLRRAKIGAKS